MDIREELTLGIDLGIGSCGWAVIREPADGGGIVALGVRTFDVPETDKDRTPTNQLRRQHRGLRKVLRRRRQRMTALRRIFRESGLIEGNGKDALKLPGLDPWRLRAEGLDRRLAGPELAVLLGHIAKHRGFKSNSKRDRGTNAPKENSEMYGAFAAEAKRMVEGGYRTVGEMFAKDPEYGRRKRNRDGDYTRSILRADQEREVRLLLSLQRRMGNALASEELERRFVDKAFEQKTIEDSEGKVGFCPFEPGEKRAAKRSYSFELFRFLSRLAALRIQSGREERALTAEEIAAASADFGAQRGMTFKRLRARIGLDTAERFEGVPLEEEGKRDVVNRSVSNGCAQGTAALREAMGEAGWRSLLATPDKFDRIAFVLTFREDVDSIRKGLEEIELGLVILNALSKAVDKGAFDDFKGAGHISAKACRALIPGLMRGLVYSKACEAVPGYDHAKSGIDRFLNTDGLSGAAALRKVLREDALQQLIGSPVARKAVTEALKQVIALVETYGVPGRIHVELARDLGKSKEERKRIKAGLDKQTNAKNKLREEFESVVGRSLTSAEDLLRYALWKEQNGFCLYTDIEIHPNLIVASDRTLEVDHILPRSRSGDDSFLNKTLCFASANQEKRGLTPYLWFGEDEARWLKFGASVERCKGLHKQKRKNYLSMKSLAEIEETFKPRNLNDTQFATKLVLSFLARMYPKGEQGFEVPRSSKPEREKRRVFARPGRLTDSLRRAWGVQDLKKDEAGARRSDDRHHALDALIVAATSESALNRLTREIQAREDAGFRREVVDFEPPWPGFLEETRTKLKEVFVSRAERHRARGKAHDATIRQIVERGGEAIIHERKRIKDLELGDLARIKDPERNAKLIESLRAWIDAGKPIDGERLPRSPKGDVIGKVRIESDARPGISILRGLKGERAGSADRTKIVRVDVFENGAPNRRSRYQFVPVYAHQVIEEVPPNRVFTLKTDYDEWPVIPADATFLFSLYPMCFVEVAWKERGAATATHVEGYFRGIDVNDGRITVSDHRSKDSKAKELQKRLSPTTLAELKKVHVDRLGRRFEIARETRTWRGAACT